MDSTSDLIIDSLRDEPIGETDHFIWFITDIGIAAVFKRNQNYETHSLNVEIEANKIGLYELNIQNDRRKKGFKKMFWEEKHYVCLWFYTTWF